MAVHEVLDPATEDVVAKVELLDVEQVDAAVARAVAVGPAWRALAPPDRALLLRRFAAAVDEHLDELAALEVRGAGHTVGNARWEAGNVRDVLHYYSAAPERLF
jgi:acyl-CoA reductase-like NAD-dependent aldehyde dehydrogenase